MTYTVGKKFVIGLAIMGLGTVLLMLFDPPNQNPILFSFAGIGLGICLADFIPN